MSYVYVAATIALSVYGQLIVKWQVNHAGHLPVSLADRVSFLLRLLTNPWILSALAAGFLAALSWMAALSKLELSHAYPFMALSFVFVLLLSGLFFGEAVTTAKIV